MCIRASCLLLRRFKTSAATPAKGLVIIPCELIDRNGDNLKEIVLGCQRMGLIDRIIHCFETSNYFLNSLVDRIVTGYPKEEAKKLADELGASIQVKYSICGSLKAIKGLRKNFPLKKQASISSGLTT